MMRGLAWCAVLLTSLAACSKPQPPEKERPPVPKAARATQMRDAIQAPIDRARQVEIDTQKAAAAQRDAIEAATGG